LLLITDTILYYYSIPFICLFQLTNINISSLPSSLLSLLLWSLACLWSAQHLSWIVVLLRNPLIFLLALLLTLLFLILLVKQDKTSSRYRNIQGCIDTIPFSVHVIQVIAPWSKYIYKSIQSINSWSYYINNRLYLVLPSIQPFSFMLNKYTIMIITKSTNFYGLFYTLLFK
jgi:hypothetical protein